MRIVLYPSATKVITMMNSKTRNGPVRLARCRRRIIQTGTAKVLKRALEESFHQKITRSRYAMMIVHT